MNEQMKLIVDEMVSRRMENTNETREQAAKHIADYLKRTLDTKDANEQQ